MHIQLASGARALDLGLGSSINMRAVKALARCLIKPLDGSAYSKINFLISQPKHILWVLKRTVLMRRFF